MARLPFAFFLLALGVASAAVAAPPASFRDCQRCPEMLVIPAGSIEIGSGDAEKKWAIANGAEMPSIVDESPRHKVTVQSFALGRYDVTVAEFRAFVRETGYIVPGGCRASSMPDARELSWASWSNPGHEPADREPVVCVSWKDAQAYVAWLNRTLSPPGNAAYRLPTEAEWEYAARAGSASFFWWGDDADGANDAAWFEANSGGRIHEAGTKRPNGYGLYDMVGNAWQWTEDCYAENYDHAPSDGSAAPGAVDCLRVDRGSSWMYARWLLRSATRERNPPDFRDVMMGFRVAKSLPAADSRYARPGQAFHAGSTSLNFYCLGSGSPTVVFDAGYGDWSPAWAIVHPEVAKWTRACAYDRAGSGFSGPAVNPRTSARIADELLAALKDGGIDGPYILVGSAYGGMNVRTFAQRHREETAGLVLVDGDATELEPARLQDDDHRSQLEIVATLTQCRDALAAGRSLELPRPGKSPLRCDRDYFFRGLPEAAWSRELNDSVAQLTRTKVAMYDALISEMAEVRGGEEWLAANEKSLGSRPIRVLSSGHHGGGPRDAGSPEGREYQRLVSQAQSKWLRLSTDSKQVFAAQSSEYIQLDEPATVLDAIREVYDAVRRNGAAR